MTEIDVEWARSQFPAFARPELADWAHLENAGGSFVCQQVLDITDDYLRGTRIQAYGHYPAGAAAGAAMAAGRAGLARHLGVTDDELFIGPSTTQHTYVLAAALRDVLGDGDAVIVTEQDHEANSGAWRRLADVGVTIREWRVDPDTGALALADLETLLDDDVAVVAFPHASNIVGDPNDVAAICARVRAAGAVSIVDGVAAAPHGLPDVRELGADVYIFSAYKTFGPHQGVMTVTADLLARLPNQGHFFNDGLPGRNLVPAGPDHAQVAALAGVTGYLDAVAAHLGGVSRAETSAAMQRRETQLLGPLLDFLRDRSGVRILGPDRPGARVPTVAIALAEPGLVVAERLAKHRIMSAGGHFYAYRLLEAMGVGAAHGCLRLSFLHYTAEWEIERAIDALDQELP